LKAFEPENNRAVLNGDSQDKSKKKRNEPESMIAARRIFALFGFMPNVVWMPMCDHAASRVGGDGIR
jgi:hypothetical protein